MTDPDQPQDGTKRPSFTSFWKRGKEKLKGKEIKFVEQGNQATPKPPRAQTQSSQSPQAAGRSPPNKSQTRSEKAKLRRAQVRRAQIQHRQRKAEYVKQLELDASHYRELISLVEVETKGLKSQNEAMKVQLQGLGVPLPVPTTANQSLPEQPDENKMDIDSAVNTYIPPETQLVSTEPVQVQPFNDISPVQQPLPDPETSEIFGNIKIEDFTVTLKNDNNLGTPVFEICTSEGCSSYPASPATVQSETKLTPEQELTVVNFILALEHVCWNHFYLGDFAGHEHESDTAMGHSLMASTMCMAGAPESAFLGRKVGPDGHVCSKSLAQSQEPVDLRWSTPGISLDSLNGLATSLNPGDKELTPVQAWFELQSRYPLDLLLDPKVQETLKREFNGVVLCLKFGAVIDREAFDSVTTRILGPWDTRSQIT